MIRHGRAGGIAPHEPRTAGDRPERHTSPAAAAGRAGDPGRGGLRADPVDCSTDAADLLSNVIWDTLPDALERRSERLVDHPRAHGHRTGGRHRAAGAARARRPRLGHDRARRQAACRCGRCPGSRVVTLLGLAGGVSLGPENPIIAINSRDHGRDLRPADPAGVRTGRDAPGGVRDDRGAVRHAGRGGARVHRPGRRGAKRAARSGTSSSSRWPPRERHPSRCTFWALRRSRSTCPRTARRRRSTS